MSLRIKPIHFSVTLVCAGLSSQVTYCYNMFEWNLCLNLFSWEHKAVPPILKEEHLDDQRSGSLHLVKSAAVNRAVKYMAKSRCSVFLCFF